MAKFDEDGQQIYELTKEEWEAHDWYEIDYCRKRTTEIWILEAVVSSEPEREERLLAYVVKKSVNKHVHVYSRLRDMAATLCSESAYKDCTLELDEFVKAARYLPHVPYDQWPEELRRNPPAELEARKTPEIQPDSQSSSSSE